MNDISKVRFEALAAYCRQPFAPAVAEEIRWLQLHDEAILIVLIRDHADGDYAAIILARDMKERYRYVEMTGFFDSLDAALAEAPNVAERIYADFDAQRAQGDEEGEPVDFFSPIVPEERLNRDFTTITTNEGYSPAVELMKSMMRWHEDADGNFVEQFQTSGFDARLWELYVFAMLVEAGYIFDKSVAVPDFQASNMHGEICVEATTVNPSRDSQGNELPPLILDTEAKVKEFQEKTMPIRFARRLKAKLAKKYWERENVKERPLLIAIQDFHAPMSMLTSRAVLPNYLYGMKWNWYHNESGNLVIVPVKVGGSPSNSTNGDPGFFDLPGAENISAVIANASATISKFNRIGVVAGFGSDRVRMIRKGTAYKYAADAAEPNQFLHDVNAAEYSESWIEGTDVFHNPRAKYPLDPGMLPGAAHHRINDQGQMESLVPAWQPFVSVTQISIFNGD